MQGGEEVGYNLPAAGEGLLASSTSVHCIASAGIPGASVFAFPAA